MIDFDVKVNCYGFVNKILISASRLFVNKTIRITKKLNTPSYQLSKYNINTNDII